MHLSGVGLIAHPAPGAQAAVAHIVRWAADLGARAYTLSGQRAMTPPGAVAVPAEELLQRCEVLIAAGGDGTVLVALHVAAGSEVPVLGVNLGHLGFLAEADAPELPAALAAFGAGAFSVEEWAPLELEVHGGGGAGRRGPAFNDIVLSRLPGEGRAALGVRVNGEVFARFAGDGLIVATAGGSTAYSFSAGGPIVSPRVRALVITPVAPHGPFRTPLVIAASDELRLEVLAGSPPVLLELDGRLAGRLEAPRSLGVRLSDRTARVARLDSGNFFRRARRKLQVMDPLELDETTPPGQH